MESIQVHIKRYRYGYFYKCILYNMASGFPQTEKPKRKGKGKAEAKMFLITQTQKSYTITFSISYWLHKSTLFNMRSYEGVDTRR